MPKKIYYGNFQNKRKSDGKKRFIIILSVIIIIGAVIWLTVFFGATAKKDVADAVRGKVQEITQLKLQIKERDDRIAQLEAAISAYEAELALRPTIEPLSIEPPNQEVLSGQPSPTPTPKPTKTPSKRSGQNSSNSSNSGNKTPTQPNQSGQTNQSGQSGQSNQSNQSGQSGQTNQINNPPANQDSIVRIGDDARIPAGSSHSSLSDNAAGENNPHDSPQNAQSDSQNSGSAPHGNANENVPAALPDAYSE